MNNLILQLSASDYIGIAGVAVPTMVAIIASTLRILSDIRVIHYRLRRIERKLGLDDE